MGSSFIWKKKTFIRKNFFRKKKLKRNEKRTEQQTDAMKMDMKVLGVMLALCAWLAASETTDLTIKNVFVSTYYDYEEAKNNKNGVSIRRERSCSYNALSKRAERYLFVEAYSTVDSGYYICYL